LPRSQDAWDQIIREVIEIVFNMNREDGFSLTRLWNPLILYLKNRNRLLSSEKGDFFSSYFCNQPQQPCTTSSIHMLGDSLLTEIFFLPSFLVSVWPIPTAVPSCNPVSPSTFQLHTFNPEGGEGMFLRNINVYC
jgi:hypothetical protein